MILTPQSIALEISREFTTDVTTCVCMNELQYSGVRVNQVYILLNWTDHNTIDEVVQYIKSRGLNITYNKNAGWNDRVCTEGGIRDDNEYKRYLEQIARGGPSYHHLAKVRKIAVTFQIN